MSINLPKRRGDRTQRYFLEWHLDEVPAGQAEGQRCGDLRRQ